MAEQNDEMQQIVEMLSDVPDSHDELISQQDQIVEAYVQDQVNNNNMNESYDENTREFSIRKSPFY